MAQPDLLTLHGTVTAGVESGCVILRDDRGNTWTLHDNRGIAGSSSTACRRTSSPVSGWRSAAELRNDLASYCMQGHIVSWSR
jgi:hypothetical protein